MPCVLAHMPIYRVFPLAGFALITSANSEASLSSRDLCTHKMPEHVFLFSHEPVGAVPALLY